jgi:hypothetical protein
MSRTFARHRLLSAPRIGLAGLALAAILTTGAVAGGKCQDEAPASPVTAAAVVAPVAMPAPLAPVAPAVVAPAAELVDATLDRLAANAPGLQRDVLRLALAARDEAAT